MAKPLGIEVQYGKSVLGGGVSFADFDKDGWDDLTFATTKGKPLQFYRNNQGTFELVSPPYLSETGEAKHVLWVDYDNDGDLDLFVSNFDGPNRLYENNGFTFEDVTEKKGLPIENLTSLGVAWADYDRDGLLDLYITDKRYDGDPSTSSNRLFKNNGEKGFIEKTLVCGVADSSKLPFCATFFDFDQDDWLDIYIVQDLSPHSTLFKNRGNNSFMDVALKTNSHLPEVSGMGIALGDVDNNGFEDLYVTNMPPGNKLLLNSGESFDEVSENYGTEFHGIGWGTNFLDIDNDMDLDLYVSGCSEGGKYSSSTIFINQGLEFERFDLVETPLESYSNAIGDIDNDGYPDVVVNQEGNEMASLWKSNAGDYGWVKFELVGTLSNRDAIGSRVEIFIEGKKYMKSRTCGISFLGQNSQYLHFGLKEYSQVDSAKIQWPSGHIDHLYNIDANETHKVIEGESTFFQPKIQSKNSGQVCPDEEVEIGVGLYSSELNYRWSNGELMPQIRVGESGTYSVSVSGNGIEYQDSIAVELGFTNSFSDLEIEAHDPLCFGEESGSISVHASDLQYIEWEKTDTSRTMNNLSAGEYLGYAESVDGCIQNLSILLSDPPKLEVVTNRNESSGWAVVTGGTPPYAYQWNNPEKSTTDSIQFAENGIYAVEVQDSNGCIENANLAYYRTSLLHVLGLPEESPSAPKLYPNPLRVGREVRISNDKGVQRIMVYSASGSLILSRSLTEDQKRILLDITEGMYLIQLFARDEIFFQRLIVH